MVSTRRTARAARTIPIIQSARAHRAERRESHRRRPPPRPDCVVCLEACASTVDLPCCHVDGATMQICRACAARLFDQPGPCPKCRAWLARSADDQLERAPRVDPAPAGIPTSVVMDMTLRMFGALPAGVHEMMGRVLPTLLQSIMTPNTPLHQVHEVARGLVADEVGRDPELLDQLERTFADLPALLRVAAPWAVVAH